MSGSITSTQIVNRALQEIAAQAVVTGLVPNLQGGGAASIAANQLYAGVVTLLLREQDWEFSRTSALLQPSGNPPLVGWSFEYLYPSDCLKIRQVFPSAWSANDPQPVRWSENNRVVNATPYTAIECNIDGAMLSYTTSAIVESQWNSEFQEAVVRLLGSELVMALAGRPDFSKVKLTEAGSLVANAGGKDS